MELVTGDYLAALLMATLYALHGVEPEYRAAEAQRFADAVLDAFPKLYDA